jgi:hypothetical protein
MTYTFKLSRRIARLRAPVFAAAAALIVTLAGCNSTDSLSPNGPLPEAGPQGAETLDPSFATSFPGGIPIGISDMPTSLFGSRYDGALRQIWPEYLLRELAGIKERGGKVVLAMAGGTQFYTDGSGNFSFDMWKQRINRFKAVDFSSYVNDGTIVAHYLIDEPNDPSNWNGKPISPATVEQMAQYSKSIWPNMATIARVEPGYLNTAHYLDAAWAQYVTRKGTADDYIKRNVADAQARGLALVVGLNVIKGGYNGGAMTASQVQSWGSTLLASSYPCAFISWRYEADYLSSSGMQAAMDVLRSKAQNRSLRSCRASGSSTTTPPPPPPSSVTGTRPFGLSEAPSEEYSTRWTGAAYDADPASLVARLGRAQSSQMKIVVRLASTGLKNADGTFSLTRWKAQIDRYRTLSLGSYITGKTFYLHDLIDQPQCASCWGGQAVSWATVEEMARYSKSIWPALPTTARVPPSKLAQATFRWTYLDAGWADYNTALGDLKTYLAGQAAQAKLEGLGLVAGLNLLDASGYNTAPMTASQVKQFGTILATDPSVCTVVGRSYDAAYLNLTGIRAALDSVTAVAKTHAAASCVVS